jgi:hypothetical protein
VVVAKGELFIALFLQFIKRHEPIDGLPATGSARLFKIKEETVFEALGIRVPANEAASPPFLGQLEIVLGYIILWVAGFTQRERGIKLALPLKEGTTTATHRLSGTTHAIINSDSI